MPLDHFVTLGRSGLRVSPLCLGTMTFGQDWGWGSTPEESFAILDAYREAGGNFIDTADIYTKGHSEAIIGQWLRQRAGAEGGTEGGGRMIVATKFFGNMFPGDPNGGGASRRRLMDSLEDSLRRLGRDHVDLYWLHAHDPFTPVEETMRALDDAVRAGKARYIGFSDTPAWFLARAQTMAEFRGWSPIIALQVEYSLLQRTVEGELIPAALELGMGVTPWSPLASGALSGKYSRRNQKGEEGGRQWVGGKLDERALTIIDALEAVAREIGSTVSRVALAWVRSRPGVASTIFGARTPAQLADNLGSLEVTLAPEQRARLDEVSRPALNFPHDFLLRSGPFLQGGATINGRASAAWDMAPQSDAERY